LELKYQLFFLYGELNVKNKNNFCSAFMHFNFCKIKKKSNLHYTRLIPFRVSYKYRERFPLTYKKESVQEMNLEPTAKGVGRKFSRGRPTEKRPKINKKKTKNSTVCFFQGGGRAKEK